MKRVGLVLLVGVAVAGCIGDQSVRNATDECGGYFDKCERGCNTELPGMCTRACQSNGECPSGYKCSTSGGHCVGAVCIKYCDTSADCPAEMSCESFGINTYCLPAKWAED